MCILLIPSHETKAIVFLLSLFTSRILEGPFFLLNFLLFRFFSEGGGGEREKIHTFSFSCTVLLREGKK